MKKVCSADGCERPAKKRGLCAAHYRWHHVRGTLPHEWETPPRRNPKLVFLKQALAMSTDECINWPFALLTVGYGFLSINGKVKSAHRAVCEMAHGVPPKDGLDAAHSCGNRTCVNPSHLRWATRKENVADTVRHGRHTRGVTHPGSRLTAEQVMKIYNDTRPDPSIAKDYGCSPETVYYIQAGRTWRSVTGAVDPH